MKLLRFAIFIVVLIISSCSKKESETGCEGSDCVAIEAPPRFGNLTVEAADTQFLDLNSGESVLLPKTKQDLGDVGLIPAYSHLINQDLSKTIDDIIASEQVESGAVNNIPYFKIKIKNDETYQFSYTRSLGSNIVAGFNGDLTIRHGDFLYIPLINSVFNNQLSDVIISASNSSDYIHTLNITPVSAKASSFETKTIKFRLLINFPPKNFITKLSDDFLNFNLDNRWNYYYKGEGVANTNLPFGYVEDAQEEPDSQSADIKIVFKNKPVVMVHQILFDEEVLDLDQFRESKAVVAYRNEMFGKRTINMTSQNHFKLKFSLGNKNVSLENSELEVRNTSPNTKWRLGFILDLTPNPQYPPGKALLTPLATACHQIYGMGAFLPLTEKAKKEASSSASYYSSCHPETSKSQTIDATNNPQNLSLKDTWFNAFSYLQSNMVFNSSNLSITNLGHFYGVQEVVFRISGCMRVYSRQASSLNVNPNAWELKSLPDDICEDSHIGGWSYFSLEKRAMLSDLLHKYQNEVDIQIAIHSLFNKPSRDRLDFMINGDTGINLERFY